jgi:hypothetical protein
MPSILERTAEPGGLDPDDPLLRGLGGEVILISDTFVEEAPKSHGPGES